MTDWASLRSASEVEAARLNAAWGSLTSARTDHDVILAMAMIIKSLSAQLKLTDKAVGYLLDQQKRTKIPCKN
jgi:hypothetical protein